MTMTRRTGAWPLMALGLAMALLHLLNCPAVAAMDPIQELDWHVEYMPLHMLGVEQRVIAINGQFPGPQLQTSTDTIVSLNVHNKLDDPFLLTWNGIQQRRNAWQDGVLGTNCPILPGESWTYKFKAKDQVGSFSYFPSTSLHRTAGAFGSIRVDPRDKIVSPFPPPADDIAVLIGDWYKANHKVLQAMLDNGSTLPAPDAVLINGHAPLGAIFTVEKGKTYRFRVSNIGSSQALNFRIEGHQLFLVEVEGSYVESRHLDSLDVHLGQTYSVLVTMDQSDRDYYLVASTRFALPELNGIGVLHYANSTSKVSGELPLAPADPNFSVNQARSTTWNLTSNAARANPQGAYHYGNIPVTNSVKFANSAPTLFGKQRFAINNVSHFIPDTPLKLADYYHISNVFKSVPQHPIHEPTHAVSVLESPYRAFAEIIFQNDELSPQSWHIDGYAFWVVAFGTGVWNATARASYNLQNALSRSTTQVYPNAWTAVLMSVDNPGLWNIRSAELQRQYLGQELYLRVVTGPRENWKRKEHAPPQNVLLCGQARNFRGSAALAASSPAATPGP